MNTAAIQPLDGERADLRPHRRPVTAEVFLDHLGEDVFVRGVVDDEFGIRVDSLQRLLVSPEHPGVWEWSEELIDPRALSDGDLERAVLALEANS